MDFKISEPWTRRMMELVKCADNFPVVDPRDTPAKKKETSVKSNTIEEGNLTMHGRPCG
jgi:hypothetical protein